MISLGAFSSPREVALEGERIYAEKFKAQYEPAYSGQFAAIDVVSGEVFVGKFPEEAIEKARAVVPNGLLHLIRIGSPGAFQVSFFARNDARLEWAL
jgi:hypothetical protein